MCGGYVVKIKYILFLSIPANFHICIRLNVFMIFSILIFSSICDSLRFIEEKKTETLIV